MSENGSAITFFCYTKNAGYQECSSVPFAHTKSRSIWRISEQWISKKRVLLDVFVRRILEVVSLSVARIGFLCICSVEGATVRLWRLPHDSIHIQRWLDRKLTFLSVLLSLSILMINHSVCLDLFMISIDITCTLKLIIYIISDVYIFFNYVCVCVCVQSRQSACSKHSHTFVSSQSSWSYDVRPANTSKEKKLSPSCITPGVHIQAIGIHCISITLQCAGQITESQGELLASTW